MTGTLSMPVRTPYQLQSAIDSARDGSGTVHIPAWKLPSGRNY